MNYTLNFLILLLLALPACQESSTIPDLSDAATNGPAKRSSIEEQVYANIMATKLKIPNSNTYLV